MSDFFRELIGVKCDFTTAEGEDYYEYVLKDISGEWVVIEDDDESIYLNLRYVISIEISSDDDKPKKGFFGKRKDEI